MRALRFLFRSAVVFALAHSLLAQDLKSPPLPTVVGSERVDGRLFELVRNIPAAERAQLTAERRAAVRTRAEKLNVKVRDDDKLFVEIVGPATGQIERDLALAQLEALGIEIGRPVGEALAQGQGKSLHVPLLRTANRAEAWLPLAAIERIEALLPKGWRIRPVKPPEEDQAIAGEGPARINSQGYRDNGANGNGLTIAIIDGSFAGLTAAQNNGDAPANATRINLTTNTDFESGTNTHGTDCVQNVFDHAPGAIYRIYRTDSEADYNAIVTDCINNGVDIISHSLSQYNEGWGDDTGPSAQEANRAAQNNILYFTSCGNRSDSHYEGAFVDADGDGFHEFAPGDETIDVTIGIVPGSNPQVNIRGNHYLSWSNSSSDFDLLLYDDNGGNPNNLVMSGVNVGNGVFETFNYNSGMNQATFHLAVRRRGGSTNSTIEMFSHNSATWNQHAVAAGSNTSPSNATHVNVIAVGAVTQASYGSAAGANVIAGYSSRGPSNSGMSLPDICGPTDVLVFPSGTFGGTSSATPNSAGAAAAFWSADTNLNANAIRWLLTTQARLFRDWGAGGFDGVYGEGGIRLVDFRAGTRWLARNYPGIVDDGTVPFHTVAAAHQRVPNGGRLLIFGANFGTFAEAAQLGQLGKGFVVEVVPNSAPARIGN